ncbi:hypothetical protein, variant [Allomyces macrogynus ATCC 38327]|uniref:C2 domain-containing protein n=1 Tax=Allomyces macrogynus (strain ATCC 38327) TaxID=578462 RepID=A0A0L0T2D3_ALLM3|nr:hypothetical protein, variant [Allomyces macrogynus ATCC 38327]|eukprot:KNE68983.1 hypothetical protein, variant [Allomyces macrogynus ATCC 38327]
MTSYAGAPPILGTLHVRLERARDLRSVVVPGLKMNPYAVAAPSGSGDRKRTRALQGAHTYAQWDADEADCHLTFSITAVTRTKLVVEVVHDRLMGEDKVIGAAEVPFAHVLRPGAQKVHDWFQLLYTSKKGTHAAGGMLVKAGEVRVQIWFEPANSAPIHTAPPPPVAVAAAYPAHVPAAAYPTHATVATHPTHATVAPAVTGYPMMAQPTPYYFYPTPVPGHGAPAPGYPPTPGHPPVPAGYPPTAGYAPPNPYPPPTASALYPAGAPPFAMMPVAMGPAPPPAPVGPWVLPPMPAGSVPVGAFWLPPGGPISGRPREP